CSASAAATSDKPDSRLSTAGRRVSAPTKEPVMSNVRPDGHHVITPSFVVHGAGKVLTFLERAFGGKVVERYEGPGGTVAHAEIKIGDSVVMAGDADDQHGMPAMPASFSFYVAEAADVDATFKRALEAGATSVRPPADQF